MNTNHHLSKPVMIGEIQADGQFDVVWQTQGRDQGRRLEPLSAGRQGQSRRLDLPLGLRQLHVAPKYTDCTGAGPHPPSPGGAGSAPPPDRRSGVTDSLPLAKGSEQRLVHRARLVRLFAFVLILSAARMPARADDFDGARAASAADSFADKEQAVIALGKLGDPGRCRCWRRCRRPAVQPQADGRVVDQRRRRDVDADRRRRPAKRWPMRPRRLSASASTTGCAARSTRRSAALTLLSPDPAARLAAAAGRCCGTPRRRARRCWTRRSPRETGSRAFEPAMRAEPGGAARCVSRQPRRSSSPRSRALGTTTDPQVRACSTSVRAAPDTDAGVAQAAEAALAAIENAAVAGRARRQPVPGHQPRLACCCSPRSASPSPSA